MNKNLTVSDLMKILSNVENKDAEIIIRYEGYDDGYPEEYDMAIETPEDIKINDNSVIFDIYNY